MFLGAQLIGILNQLYCPDFVSLRQDVPFKKTIKIFSKQWMLVQASIFFQKDFTIQKFLPHMSNVSTTLRLIVKDLRCESVSQEEQRNVYLKTVLWTTAEHRRGLQPYGEKITTIQASGRAPCQQRLLVRRLEEQCGCGWWRRWRMGRTGRMPIWGPGK